MKRQVAGAERGSVPVHQRKGGKLILDGARSGGGGEVGELKGHIIAKSAGAHVQQQRAVGSVWVGPDQALPLDVQLCGGDDGGVGDATMY